MSKETVTARMERIRKTGRPHKRWTNKVEENLKIKGIEIGIE
jgi:hypothetical protein